jgi:hypothetical protein
MLAVGRGHSWRALPIMIKKEVALMAILMHKHVTNCVILSSIELSGSFSYD